MKIIRISLNDYDKPLVALMAVNDADVQATYSTLMEHNPPYEGEDVQERPFIIDIDTPDTLESVIAEMDKINK